MKNQDRLMQVELRRAYSHVININQVCKNTVGHQLRTHDFANISGIYFHNLLPNGTDIYLYGV